MDGIESAMTGTTHESLIREVFFGMLDTVVICCECQVSRKRPEPYLDLMLNVKGFKNIEESLLSQFSFETLDDDNKLTCDNCDTKTKSQKG